MEDSRKKRRVVRGEGREMIANVYRFLKDEYVFTELHREPNCDISHLRNITKRTAEATAVSERTVQKILQEERNIAKSGNVSGGSSSFVSPMKKRKKRECKVDIDSVTADVVRSTIQEFHILHKENPTLAKLKSIFNEIIGFDGCLATLRKLLMKLGYRWRKTGNKKKVLVERHGIQMWRLNYLKKISAYRSEDRPIVYTGENFVSTHVRNNTAAQKAILVHAGTDAGFIENACLIYKANSIVGSNISFEDYVKWFDEKLLPNLPDRAVIVLDNEHQNARAEKLPTSATKKSEMQDWLTSKGIQFDTNLRRVELYDIIKKHKKDFITYKIDDYINSKGFDVLRLPPYHPELNAIETIWGVFKNYIAQINTEQYITSTERLVQESIKTITSETWLNTCNNVVKKEIQYMKHFDTDFELVIDLEGDSDSDDETDSEESSYDSN